MPTPESILVTDIGSVKTKVGLVDLVGPEYRLVAAASSLTTIGIYGDNVLDGIRRAVEEIQTLVDRPLLSTDGQLIEPESSDGAGVDAFVAVTSALPPLNVAVVGLCREVSVAAAARAATGTYAQIVSTVALDQMGGRWLRLGSNGKEPSGAQHSEAQPQDPSVIAAEGLARANLDVIVLVGGIDGGATTGLYEIANLVASVAAAREPSMRPEIIFAGNLEARSEINARLGAITSLRIVDNVHPALESDNPEALLRELELLYEEKRISPMPGFDGLSAWLQHPIMTSARGFEYVVRFLARRYSMGVLGVDIGATTTTLVSALPDSVTRVVRADLGVGRSLEKVIAQAGMDRLIGWVPDHELSVDDAMSRWLNRSIHPGIIPATREDWYLSQAVAREALTIAARDAELNTDGIDLVLMTGGVFSRHTNQGGLVLLALDALAPKAVLTFASDSFGLVPAFGALATVNARAATNVIEQDAFTSLATVVGVSSSHREGTVDVRAKITSPGIGEMSLEIEHGNLELLPVPAGQKATVQVQPAPDVDIGRPKGVPLEMEIDGGSLGLVIDARGRPIPLPFEIDKRRRKTQEWLWDLGG
jgi:MutL-like protein